MKTLVISCSLNAASRSFLLATELSQVLRDLGNEVELLDLRKLGLPLCDGAQAAGLDPSLARTIREADAVVLSTPIYNYDVGPAVRNLIAVTGAAWADKIVGICAAAGGSRSFMALANLANSLMLDFRCLIVPRFVYATHDDFAGERLESPAVRERLDLLARELTRIAEALRRPQQPAAAIADPSSLAVKQ
jgi:FMN reductase